MMEKKRNLKAVFMDLDGTVTDPRVGITRCIQVALERMGFAVPPMESLIRYIGPPLRESLGELMGHPGEEKISMALDLYRQRFSEKGLYENRVYPGIEDFLNSAMIQDWPLYLVTAKPEVFASRILDHFSLSRYFRGIFGSRFDGSLTLKKDLIRHVLERLDINGTDAVMIGDRRQDIEGAHENGLFAVGVTYGFGSSEELKEAERICDTPEQLTAILSEIFTDRNKGK